MKRSADGCCAQPAALERAEPSLQAVETHRWILHDEAVEEVLALGNDGSTVQRSRSYWAITAGGTTRNGLALTLPHGCRPPVSLMNDRAAAVCAEGVALLTTTGQTVLAMNPPPLACYQLFESDVLILLWESRAAAVQPEGITAELATPSAPLSVAHDTEYRVVDVVCRDGTRYRYDESFGWHPITLPRPDVDAVLRSFNVRSGGSAWLTGSGDLLFYHMAPDPVVTLPVGLNAAVTASDHHLYVLLDNASYPTVVPEVGVIDTRTLSHYGTLFPDQLLGMGRIGDSCVTAAHFPYVLWRNALFKLA
jgi:hypothetical protein